MLEAPADAGPEAARSAFLKRLASLDFAPPETWNAAAVRLGTARLPLSPDAVDALVEFEKADVSEFVGRYWELSPEDRTARWGELNARCRDPEVQETLDRLREGLSLEVGVPADPLSGEAAGFVREMFLLPPREAGLRRLAWWAERAENRYPDDLGSAFERLDVATQNLVPQLAGDMLRAEEMPRKVAEMTPQQRVQLEAEVSRKAQRKQGREATRVLPESASSSWSWQHWGVLLFLASAFIRGCMALSGSGSSSSVYPTKLYYSPTNHAVPTRRGALTSEQIRAFTEFKRVEHDLNQTAPPQYWEWRDFSYRFTPFVLRAFREYDPKSGRPEPEHYRLWRRSEGLADLPARR